MKIRTDFVTNSSSSSYVIAFKGFDLIDEETKRKYEFLRNYEELVKRALSDDDHSLIRTLDELNEYYIYDYGNRDDTIEQVLEREDYLQEDYNKAKEYLEKGYCISHKRFDWHEDEGLMNLITDMADGDQVIIIGGDY